MRDLIKDTKAFGVLPVIITIVVGIILLMIASVLIGNIYVSMPTSGIPATLNTTINDTITKTGDAFDMTMIVFIVLPAVLIIGVLIRSFGGMR